MSPAATSQASKLSPKAHCRPWKPLRPYCILLPFPVPFSRSHVRSRPRRLKARERNITSSAFTGRGWASLRMAILSGLGRDSASSCELGACGLPLARRRGLLGDGTDHGTHSTYDFMRSISPTAGCIGCHGQSSVPSQSSVKVLEVKYSESKFYHVRPTTARIWSKWHILP